jgi:hypothetical protein
MNTKARIWDNKESRFETIDYVRFLSANSAMGNGVCAIEIETQYKGVKQIFVFQKPRYELEFIHYS